MLERRHAEDEVERACVEREPAHVGLHRRHPGDVALREVDAAELLRAKRKYGGDPRRLCERVADVEDPPLAAVAAERPGELDRPLVELGRRDELVRSLARRPCGSAAADSVVERAQTAELLAVGKLGEQPGAREPVLRQRRQREVARLVVGRAAQEEPEGPLDELLVRKRSQVEVRREPLVHPGDSTCGLLPAVLVEALSTGHKVGLGVVGALFIVFALSCAFLFPRVRSSFPGRGLPAFIVVSVVFFFGMLTAVEVFGAEPKEAGAEPAGESTSESTTTQTQPTTTAPTTTTVALPPTTTTTKKPPPAAAQTISVTETEFKIALKKQPGSGA